MINTETLMITPAMLKLIAQIDEFKGSWAALGKLEPQRLEALRHTATIESIGSSNRIEGNELTDQQVEALLKNIQSQSLNTRDEQEVAGYADVMETIFESYDEIKITSNLIKQLHRDLLKYSTKDSRHRGEYKSISNTIEAFDQEGKSMGTILKTASPFDTPRYMDELISWVDEQIKQDELHPLIIVAVFVVVFLEIHPFQDGNGRISRALTTLLLLKFGYSYVPYSSMESVIEQSKDRYYIALRRTQVTIRTDKPNWNDWVMFFLKSVQKQKQNLKQKIQYEQIAIAELPKLSLEIMSFIKDHGRGSVKELSVATGKSRSTIKDHLKNLVEKQHLKMHGSGRGTWYGLI